MDAPDAEDESDAGSEHSAPGVDSGSAVAGDSSEDSAGDGPRSAEPVGSADDGRVDESGETDTDSPGAGGDDPSDGAPEPTPQSAALRRQQAYVGTGGALVAGGALTVIVFQQYTDNLVLALLAGLVGSAAVLWLVRRSIFPGETAEE